MFIKNSAVAGFFCFAGLISAVSAQNSAPSSHLDYNDATFPGDVLVNEVRVPKTGEAMYTYYETLGWSGVAGGYAGIQAHPEGHNYIFSIWDNKAQTAPIKAVYQDAGTKVQPFGGEGTGLKSWNFQLGWETDVWYATVARCWPVGDHTFFGYWVYSTKTQVWTHMVTMDVAAKDAFFQGGNDSFIEDWLATGKEARTTNLRRGWKRNKEGKWHAFAKAHYSVNSWDLVEGKRSFNFRTSWDAGVSSDETGKFYYMTSGGADTKPTTKQPADFSIPRDEKAPDYAPVKITSAKATALADGKVKIAWELDAKGAPQFMFAVSAKAASGERVSLVDKTDPEARSHEFELPAGFDLKKSELELHCRDLFDNLVTSKL